MEVGLRPGALSRYRYAPGEMILCRRHTEEWVRSQSPIEMLMLAVPDEALKAVAEEMGGGEPELIATARFEDERIHALMTAVEVEQAGGFLAGRLYLDAIGQALAAALVQSRGVLRKPMRQYRGGLAYFSQKFRQSTGVAPHQFVLRARVERAKDMLRKPEARVLDVAVACGFQTQQHFARVFRALCKASPSEYRRELGVHFQLYDR